jgi:uncharacterized membrane protein YhaH (DUF805 family)
LGGIFGAEDVVENNTGRSHVRDWIDPLRLYDPRVPAGRLVFLWGLVGYPLLVMFVFLTAAIIIMEATIPSANVGDDIGIVTWIFMLAWVMATVGITRRRLLQLGKSQAWVWVAILPVVNLILFLYLLLKSDPVASYPVA